jgi:RNA polymerase sigma-70 factor (ECF subfamily)
MTTPVRSLDYGGLTEAALVARARDGDAEAFRAIMQQANQRLFRVARGIVRDEVEAEDVVQEAYVRAFQHLASFRGEASVFSWLTRITINEARGRLRKTWPIGLDGLQPGEQERGQLLMFPTAAGTGDPEREASRADTRRMLERAVDELPQAFQLVFIMREIEGCSVEETAVNLDIKPETVKTRLHRARRLLRRALEAQLGGAMSEAFPFLGTRCTRITERVLLRLHAAGLVKA